MSTSVNPAEFGEGRHARRRSFLERNFLDDSRRTLAVVIAVILAVLVLPAQVLE